MSDYNIQVTWSGKDALADSDPDKVISGGDFSTEFTAVKTAVNSKANTNGDASKDFSATTQAAGNNTTKVATTAFVKTALGLVYPVGAIFTTTTAYADSAAVVTAIGGTTWVVFGAGKVLVGVDSSDADFDTIEETGGTKTHTLTAAQLPDHNHVYKYVNGQGSGSGVNFAGSATGLAYTYTATVDETITSSTNHALDTASIAAGTYPGGGSHPIVQPYITVYMWKREA